jgi:DNA-binding MarR family transcriptional regulator
VPSKSEFAALSEFRSGLARFLRFSDEAAREAGATSAQYLLLLQLRGFPGRAWASVGELAARLDASHQGTVALVQRCERNGWVAKQRHPGDGRSVQVRLTPAGRALVGRIARRHRGELDRLAGVLRAARAGRRRDA